MSVTETLVLANDSLHSGDFLPPAPAEPYGIAFEPTTGDLFVSDNRSGGAGILVLDPRTDSWLRSFVFNGSPDALAIDPLNQLLYVTDWSGDRVEILNPSNGSVVSTVRVGHEPSDLLFDPMAGAMLVSDPGSNQISVLNASTNLLVSTFVSPKGPFHFALDAADSHIYVTQNRDPNTSDSWGCIGNLSVYNASGNLSYIGTIPVGWDPSGIAYDSANHDVYVANGFGCGVAVINGTDDRAMGDLGPPPAEFGALRVSIGIAVDPGTDQVFVSDNSYLFSVPRGYFGIIEAINGSDNRAEWLAPVDQNVVWMADDPVLDRVYVTDPTAMDVMVVNAKNASTPGVLWTQAVVGNVLTGVVPGGLEFDSRNGEAYVLDPPAAVVLEVNATTDRVTRLLNVGPDIQGLAIDPVSGSVIFGMLAESLLLDFGVSSLAPSWTAIDWDVYHGGEPDGTTSVLWSANGRILSAAEGVCGPAPYGLNPCLDSWNASSGAFLGAEVLAGMPDGTQFAVDPVAREAFLPSVDSNGTSVTIIDSSTGRGLGRVLLSPVGPPTGWNISRGAWDVGNDSVLFNPGTGRLYVGIWAASQVVTVDPSAEAKVGTPLRLTHPSALAYDSEDGVMFASSSNGTVTELNGTTGAAVTIVSAGKNPDGLGYDPLTDQLWVANAGSGTVSILNLSTGSPVPVVKVTENRTVLAAGANVTFTATVVGAAESWSYGWGLPPGCVSEDSATLVCRPSVAGTYWVTAVVHDGHDRSSGGGVSIRVTSWAYSVAFRESGLPNGTEWTLTVNGRTTTTSASVAVRELVNASYVGYRVGSEPGYLLSPTAGVFAVAGSDLTISVKFAEVPGAITEVAVGVSPPNVSLGGTVNLTVRVTGGAGPYAYAYGGLPPGCFTANRSELACTPGTMGTYTVGVEVTDDHGQQGWGTGILQVHTASPAPGPGPGGRPGGVWGLVGLFAGWTFELIAAAGAGVGVAGLIFRSRKRRQTRRIPARAGSPFRQSRG